MILFRHTDISAFSKHFYLLLNINIYIYINYIGTSHFFIPLLVYRKKITNINIFNFFIDTTKPYYTTRHCYKCAYRDLRYYIAFSLGFGETHHKRNLGVKILLNVLKIYSHVQDYNIQI